MVQSSECIREFGVSPEALAADCIAAPLADHSVNLSPHLSAITLAANSLAAHNLSPRNFPHLTCQLSNWPQLSRSLYASPLAAPLAAQSLSSQSSVLKPSLLPRS
jgi:hypothetical protein